MKQTLLVAVASAMIGAATAVFVTDKPAPVQRAPGLSKAELGAAFEDAIARAVIAVQTQQRDLGSEDGGATAERQQSPAAPLVPNDQSVTLRAQGPTRDPGLALAPPANVVRLADLANWQRNEELRRQWLFRSDGDVLKWFGTPDSVTHGSGLENWVYRIGEKKMFISFHRGRIVEVSRPRGVAPPPLDR